MKGTPCIPDINSRYRSRDRNEYIFFRETAKYFCSVERKKGMNARYFVQRDPSSQRQGKNEETSFKCSLDRTQ